MAFKMPKKPKTKKPSRSAVGVLRPDETHEVELEVAIGDDEQPVVIAQHPGSIVLMGYTGNKVRIRNTTDRLAPYALFVVERRYMKLARLPWGEIARETKKVAEVVTPWLKKLFKKA